MPAWYILAAHPVATNIIAQKKVALCVRVQLQIFYYTLTNTKKL